MKRRLLYVLVAVSLCVAQGLAGTRLYRSLEEVLALNRPVVVFSATVVETKFSQQESSDILDCRVEDVQWLHGRSKGSPSQLRFLAFRPSPSSNLKNRSVYCDGSGLEFNLKNGHRYLFICSNHRSIVRVESESNQGKVLKLLGPG